MINDIVRMVPFWTLSHMRHSNACPHAPPQMIRYMKHWCKRSGSCSWTFSKRWHLGENEYIGIKHILTFCAFVMLTWSSVEILQPGQQLRYDTSIYPPHLDYGSGILCLVEGHVLYCCLSLLYILDRDMHVGYMLWVLGLWCWYFCNAFLTYPEIKWLTCLFSSFQ